MTVDAYTGLRRRKQTPWTVKFGDAFASKMIAVGGIGTIAAILLVVLVLLGTAWPLFQPPSRPDWHAFDFPAQRHVGLDEQQVILWGADESGKIIAAAAHSGELIAEFPSAASDERKVTASSLSIEGTVLALGFSDGSFQCAELRFEQDLLNTADLPAEVEISEEKPIALHASAVYQRFDRTSVRRTQIVSPEWSAPRSLGEGPVTSIDFVGTAASKGSSPSDAYVAAIVGKEFAFGVLSRKKALIGKKITETLAVDRCSIPNRDASRGPLSVTLLNDQEHAVIAWANGTLDRISLFDGKASLAESTSALVGDGKLTATSPLLARQTLLCGDSSGRVIGWNIVRPGLDASDDQTSPKSEPPADTSESSAAPRGPTADGLQLVPAHEIQVSDVAVRSIGSSQKHHLASVLDEQGKGSLVFVTTNDLLLESTSPLGSEARFTAFDPGDDTWAVAGSNRIALTPLRLPHPESSFATFFGSVWYEGYSQPQYIWQSSAGTEKAEAKLSLMPLVFGTLKATLYAMLVSVPLALMAAIYTSEFLSPETRARVKPVVELMASLPSVVLGFVAALVIAPLLKEHLMAVLMAIMLVPLTFVLAGHLWNLLPLNKLVRLERFRLFALIACLPISLWLTWWLAPIAEQTFFLGDIVRWINSRDGSAVGGWMMVLMPLLFGLAVILLMGPMVEWTRSIAVARTPRGFALFSLLRLIVVVSAVVLVAWLIGHGLQAAGLDARGTVFGDYQDRNALLVGIALGFCVIPIIYTISDDALQAVPKQLRSASLGCGATPWQTTMRVVVPSAMSGLFSAIMVGLGRAVGETMVVLMAAGNTPVMDWNPFNGFRTLSATLATELPEAAKGSTHFRTLFLAALLLFVLTLIANTIAEFVRIRFRKRASQL